MSIGTILRRGFSETRFVATGVLFLILLRFPYGILISFVVEGNGEAFSLTGSMVTGVRHLGSLFLTPLIVAGILRKLIVRAQPQPVDEWTVTNDRVNIYPRMLGLYILYLMTTFAIMFPMFCIGGFFLWIRLGAEGVGADQAEVQISQIVSSPLWSMLSFLVSAVTNLVWCLWCVACVILVRAGATLDTSVRRALTFCKTNGSGFIAVWLTTLALDLPVFATYWLASLFKLGPPFSSFSPAVLIFPAVWNAITIAIGLSLATSLYMARRLARDDLPPASFAR